MHRVIQLCAQIFRLSNDLVSFSHDFVPLPRKRPKFVDLVLIHVDRRLQFSGTFRGEYRSESRCGAPCHLFRMGATGCDISEFDHP